MCFFGRTDGTTEPEWPEIAPNVFSMVKMQVVNKRSIKNGLNLHAWNLDIMGELPIDGLVQAIRLWEILITMELSPDTKDKPIWKWNNVGQYLAASAYKILCEGGIRFQCSLVIWRC